MEVANVAGYDGLDEFFRGAERLPYRLFVEVSSRVPTAPGLGIDLDEEYLRAHPAVPPETIAGMFEPDGGVANV